MALHNRFINSARTWFAPRTAQAAAEMENPQDDDQRFQASMAHLPLEEQHKRLQRRAMYQRMAQRQGIMEVEQRSTAYYRD